ncbi:unnamed protein product, partial [Iphiclides podalirius]
MLIHGTISRQRVASRLVFAIAQRWSHLQFQSDVKKNRSKFALESSTRSVAYKLTLPDIQDRGNSGERGAAAGVYKLKGCYLRLNTPPFPVHFRAARAAPDIAFKVAPHANVGTQPAVLSAPRSAIRPADRRHEPQMHMHH